MDYLHRKIVLCLLRVHVQLTLNEGKTLPQNTYAHSVSMGTNQPLFFSIAREWVEVDIYCVVCVWGGQGGGSRGARGSSIKQHTRQMKALHILKSNHNLVISTRWYARKKENRQDWQDGERQESISQGKGDGRLLSDGKWWTETVLFLKMMLNCCFSPHIQQQTLSLKGFLMLRYTAANTDDLGVNNDT